MSNQAVCMPQGMMMGNYKLHCYPGLHMACARSLLSMLAVKELRDTLVADGVHRALQVRSPPPASQLTLLQRSENCGSYLKCVPLDAFMWLGSLDRAW